MSTLTAYKLPILDAIREIYPNYHPLIAIAHIAHGTSDPELQFKCHQTIAKYVEPELKSVEVKVDGPKSKAILKVSLFEMDEADITDVVQIPMLEKVQNTFDKDPYESNE